MRCCSLFALALLPSAAAPQQRLEPVAAGTPVAAAVVARLGQGGLVLFFRHADTRGEPCDSRSRVGDRAGQRNISAPGREQWRAIGRRLEELRIPVAFPVLAGSV